MKHLNKLNTGETVQYILEHQPISRDDLNKLLANVWLGELGSENLKRMSGLDLLNIIANASRNHRVSMAEIVRHSRKLIQRLHPHLGKATAYEDMERLQAIEDKKNKV